MSDGRRPLPTKLSKEDLSGLTAKDFFPDREEKETNSEERMLKIQAELKTLYALHRGDKPTPERFPTLFHELPTLWALIDEGKFKYWNAKEQSLMNEMVRLKLMVVRAEVPDEEAEKQAGLSLAERFGIPFSRSGDTKRNKRG